VDRAAPLALVLGGGNALGAYQAGAYEALHARGLEPDWVIGASSGAVNAALIAGNRSDDQVGRMRAYWSVPPNARPADTGLPAFARMSMRAVGAFGTAIAGRPQSFVPRSPFAWPFDPASPAPSLYDTRPLEASLEGLLDFDRLNSGSMRVSVNAVDLETGEDVVFDNRQAPIGAAHIRASTALPPLYPPVRVDGRLLVDPGLSANLPVAIALGAPLKPAMLCIAVDVITPLASPPSTIAGTMQRRDDLLLSSQSRHAVAGCVDRFDAAGAPPVTLVHLIYADQDDEPVGKTLDYSPTTLASRWAAGRAHMTETLDRLAAGELRTAERGLTVHRVLGGLAA